MTTGHHIGRPIVVIAGVEKAFGAVTVLRDINMTVSTGETVCIIGPSGSGKSTLLRCINALAPVTKGSITVDGQQVN
uniref:ATP-binding cassette domain-containing protein n=1 Tax=Escherichia coli TaxID=562 RepID=UPI00278BC2D2